MTTRRAPLRTALPAAALAALLAACSSGGMEDMAGMDEGGGTSAAAGELTEAETSFLQGMVPHHQQAVEMAELVEDRTDRPELIELAAAITSSQEQEITEMTGLLTDAGLEAPSGMEGMEGMDHSGDSGMGGDSMRGMASEDQLADLEAASDEDFDLLFLELMTAHHEGAVEMSDQVLAADPQPSIATLAEQIRTAQTAEIEQMRGWQEEWAQ